MTFKEIKELIEVFDESSVSKLSIKEGEFKIELDKNVSSNVAQVVSTPAPQVAVTSAPAVEVSTPIPTPITNDNADYITSPMVGTFYEAASPTSDSYVFLCKSRRHSKSRSTCMYRRSYENYE